jgi:hypothetical protein
LADRTALLAELAIHFGIAYVFEQLQLRLWFHYHTLAKVLAKTVAFTIPLRMCNFGGGTLKPLRLKDTGDWLKTFLDVSKCRHKRADQAGQTPRCKECIGLHGHCDRVVSELRRRGVQRIGTAWLLITTKAIRNQALYDY